MAMSTSAHNFIEAVDDVELAEGTMPPLATHLVTSRFGYTHHGIYVGRAQVIHYSGLSRGWRAGPVEEVSLAEFARGRRVRVRTDAGVRFDPEAIVARARSRLGEKGYRPLSNNCEHFCAWCMFGVSRSRQIEELCSRLRQARDALRRFVGAPLRPLFFLMGKVTA
jgi:hypothetical protein